MTSRNYQAGEKIIAEGTYGTETFFIESGTVAIRKETGEPCTKPLAELSVGDMFGEMVLLDGAGFRSASAIAVTDVTVSVVAREQLEHDLQATPSRIRYLLDTLKKRLEATSSKLSLAQATALRLQQRLQACQLYALIITLAAVIQLAWPLAHNLLHP
ncbi:MAG: cyclic nucleotide-binding domain-containing protein [Vampirovibrionales bacterium]